MSNLLKQYYVVNSGEGKRVINYNALAEERIRSRMAENTVPTPVIKNRSEEPLPDKEESEEPAFTQGLAAQPVAPQRPDAEELAQKILADANAHADKIRKDAEQRAKLVLDDANNQAKLICEENREIGYKEGMQAREEELAAYEQQLTADMQAREEALDRRMQELESSYKERQEQMEQNIIDALIPVFEKVFRIQFGEKRDILLALTENVLANVEVGNKLRIRANEADHAMLMEHIDEIKGQVGSDVSLELLQDTHLSDGQCQIETAYGVFDCSIDTEFANLVKDIRSLV